MTLLEKYRGLEIHLDFETDGPIYYVHRSDEAEDLGSRMTLERARKLADSILDQGEAALMDSIAFGDRVTITLPHGSTVTGRATIRGPHGWVLSCGGANGTPRIATPSNIVHIKPRRLA